MITRFAPSTTGHAHPGTLMSALLCWLTARSQNGRVVLRLEDLDPQRCLPEFQQAMVEELDWLGLDWDDVVWQSQRRVSHEAALDQLADAGLLYPCLCSRSRLKSIARPAPDGGFAYDNHCRDRTLSKAGWRSCNEPLRIRLPRDRISMTDDGGLLIEQLPINDMGDPVVRRRDGAIAYHLACVVDDAAMNATHLIRGNDLASSAPVQILIQRLLGLPTPSYRHHFLLLETTGNKLAKFHGSVAVPELKKNYSAEELCGWLAFHTGILDKARAVRPVDLIPLFDWRTIRKTDLAVTWDGKSLNALPAFP